jgi:hypothetical protein
MLFSAHKYSFSILFLPLFQYDENTHAEHTLALEERKIESKISYLHKFHKDNSLLINSASWSFKIRVVVVVDFRLKLS